MPHIALTTFPRTVEELIARDLELQALLAELTPEFRQLLAVPDLLSAEQQCPGTDRYAQHLLHADPYGRFTLVALVWRPGDQTPVHDHRGWGIAGVYEGQEHETRYGWWDRPDGTTGLRPLEDRMLAPGEVVVLVPPSDIHCVVNPLTTRTISLHLYGLDLARMPAQSSVRRIYPPELLLPNGMPRSKTPSLEPHTLVPNWHMA